MELDETDALRDDVRPWKTCDAVNNRPPTMVLEVFIDTEELTNSQSLVTVDDRGRRWDVEEALGVSPTTAGSGAKQEIILERWQMMLDEPTEDLPKELGVLLPRVYKNNIVLFRSLYTYARLLPAWKFSRKLLKPRLPHGLPKLRYRIIDDALLAKRSGPDTLSIPLYQSYDRVVEHFSFGSIESPAGAFSMNVFYRSNCDFQIDDSEALLSSRFMGVNEDFFQPSLRPQDSSVPMRKQYSKPTVRVGSLPPGRVDRVGRPDLSRAYGSMSTFHQVGPQAGSSPISALRAVRDRITESPEESLNQKILPPNTRSADESRSSLRSVERVHPVVRRPSVSFNPFKAPTLSASPLQCEKTMSSSPRNSTGRTSALSTLAEDRSPHHHHTQGSSSPQGAIARQERHVKSSPSSSPKHPPVARYSSSFGHRKAKLSVSGGSKTDDDNGSSGKVSVTSSTAQPGSGILAEGSRRSSGSIQTDDDNISDFLKLLDQKKDLKSFRPPTDRATVDAATRRTTAALTKFQRMRDSNAALSESMSSSMLLHRSSSSSSRQLSSVPAMVAGTSTSISSSPGKPVSPHTPHTPAIPSRLSANSIAEYPSTGRHRLSHEEYLVDDDTSRDISLPGPSTGAIDIPISPRPYNPSYRRSSSVAQQTRTMPMEDDLGDLFPYGLRSASVGTEDRQPLSLSELAALQDQAALVGAERPFGPEPNPGDGTGLGISAPRPAGSLEGRDDGGSQQSRGVSYRPRIGRLGNRAMTPSQGSVSSHGGERGTGSGSGNSEPRGGRYSYSRRTSTNTFEEEEPLLFAMSDFGAVQQSRRSLEDARGSESGASSRRGSRRGGHAWA